MTDYEGVDMTSIIARKFIQAGIVIAAGLALGLGAAVPAHADTPPQPAPQVVVETIGQTADCAAGTVTTYQNLATTPYVPVDGGWALGVVSDSPLVSTVAITSEERAVDCTAVPTVTAAAWAAQVVACHKWRWWVIRHHRKHYYWACTEYPLP